VSAPASCDPFARRFAPLWGVVWGRVLNVSRVLCLVAGSGCRGYPSGSGDGWRLVLHDPDVVEVSAETAAEWSSSRSRRKKLKLPQVDTGNAFLSLSVFKPSFFLFRVRGLFGAR
jgi:hypothetical protein